MSPITPPALEDISAQDRERLEILEQLMGEVPVNALLFTCVPGLSAAMYDLSQAVLVPGEVDLELKWLVGHLSSRVAGCQFCSAHTAYNAARSADVSADKFAAIWEFEHSELFTPAEREALRLAAAAGQVPNAVQREQFDALRRYFNDRQILELVAVIALFGFMNRWNDTLFSPLEAGPAEYAASHLAASGWQRGKH